MNGTFREIQNRIRAFRARTGRDLSAVWISHERWQMLPEDFRISSIRGRLHREHTAAAVIDGVQIKILEVLPPEGRFRV